MADTATAAGGTQTERGQQPFAGYARVEAKTHDGTIEQGIGLMVDPYRQAGEFLFVPDRLRAAATEDSGFIRSWQVLRWADLMRVLPRRGDDEDAIDRHRRADEEKAKHGSRLKGLFAR